MKKKQNSNNQNTDMLSFLEGVDSADKNKLIASGPLKKIDIDLNLSSLLENIDSKEELGVIEQKVYKNPETIKKDIKEDLDISLNEMIKKVFDKSDRPYIIVRDDDIFYANNAFIKLIGIPNKKFAIGKKFLTFVAKRDWNILAENIGEMIANAKTVAISLKLSKKRLRKMKFEAIYLNDRQSFMFILIGEKPLARNNMPTDFYDDVTGLPAFYLLEDRVQVAVNYENNKDFHLKKKRIALIGITIDNLADFKQQKLDELIIRKIASKLVFSLKPVYTIARGIKYHFWVLITNLQDNDDIELEVRKIKSIFDEPVADDMESYTLETSIGISIYPETASSSKKLLEQSILAMKQAKESSADKIVFFKPE